MRTFSDQLADPTSGVAIDDQGSDVGLVAFGGLRGNLAMPAFEFFGLTRGLPVTKVYMRDLSSRWYADGVPGVGGNLREVAAGTRRIVRSLDTDPVLFGMSAGGFAAIAVGLLNDFAEVHAFGPQVTMKMLARRAMGDRRWIPQARALRASPHGPIVDLRPIFDEVGRSRTRVHLHVADNVLDLRQAELVADRPNVTLHRYPRGGHSFARELRATGELEQIIVDALERTRARRRSGLARAVLGPIGR